MKLICAVSPIKLDLAPQDLAYILNSIGKSGYLSFLDSSLYPSKYSKFSYLGWKPEFVIKNCSGKNEYINVDSKKSKCFDEHPLLFLKRNFNQYLNFAGIDLYVLGENNRFIRIEKNDLQKSLGKTGITSLPEFKGGFIGYLSYDLKNYLEVLPQNTKDDIKIPLFYFAFYDRIAAFDHKNKKWYYSRVFSCSLEEMKDKIRQEIQELEGLISSAIKSYIFGITAVTGKDLKSTASPGKISKKIREIIVKKYCKKHLGQLRLQSNFTKPDYLKTVSKAKKYIHNGDIYQVNITQRFKCNCPAESYDLYYILREKNPAPFSAYISFPEVSIGSSSPERFLYIHNGAVQTRPIKGTRPRGKNKSEDQEFINELKSSLKERAELNMIVDLERNDLGKFCDYGSVEVKEHAVIEKYARVFHSVSTVTGRIRSGFDLADIIKATFPGGSITGAPKIRAMQIIDELEPVTRNIYTGSLGYIGIDGTIDLNIVIRTFIIKDGKLYYNVGGGIVEDSDEVQEYKETMDKGSALLEAIKFFKIMTLEKENV